MKRFMALTLAWLALAVSSQAQGFLHTDGDRIVDGNGNNFFIRSTGTGNWMLQEGYMMQTAGVAGTQHEFRAKLIETIGEARTDSFYMAWLNNHFTKRDLDSMKAWGFNAVRPALHYKWFTLPIEDEPVPFENTWLDIGFALTDSLVKWCTENEMYVIFDMHGAPGGQGANADISDYDPSKPSLWESEENKSKLVALWYKIAERYSDEPWVGGYDLINETNWTFPEGNNSQMRNIYQRLTDTIRLVDNNHIIFIEGNWFANDFSGLTPPWDDNMSYSFHKYWSSNDDNSLSYATWLRDDYNVPLWLGETGENSNTWFTNLIALCEKENIGWSWWPLKKGGINNPLQVKVNPDYTRLIDSWRGQASAPTADEAYAAVMQFAKNHRIENCIIQYDVIDAMFRQPYTTDIKPFRKYSVEDYIFATDYALGRNGFAYFDNDTADYHGDTDEFTAWNQGYAYRNDGVDIEACSDTDTTNGFNVGWIESGEWLVYPIENNEEALVDVNFRYASGSGGGNVVIEIDGKVASNPVNLTGTGGWQNWSSATATDILIPAGNFNLKLRFPDGGFNLNYFRFENFRDPQAATFKVLYAETSETKNEVFIHLNKSISSWDVQEGDFKLEINNGDANITDISYEPGGDVIKITTDKLIYPGRLIIVSYTGSGIESESGPLDPFTDLQVNNQMARFFNLPVKIQAEYFYVNNGFVLEDCQDIGFGQNTGYADPGDYLDYLIYVPDPGLYKIESRVALQGGNALLYFSYSDDEELSGEKFTSYSSTGGWQSWQTQETTMELPAGKFRFRIRSHTGAFNLNWFEFSLVTGFENEEEKPNISFYPNPVSDILTINFDNPSSEPRHISIYNSLGLKFYSNHTFDQDYRIDANHFHPGLYFLVIGDGGNSKGFRFLKQ